MNARESTPLPRSPEIMSADDTALLVVDVQEKLVRLVPGHERLVWNVGRLIDGAQLMQVPVLGTEQYPQGLGPTTPELATKLGPLPGKLTFSCCGCDETITRLSELGRIKVLIAGIEAHVCVMQTALDMLAAGYRVYLAVDAIGARYEIDYRTALRRLEAHGASLVTTEMALFEWCRVAGTPQFKELSALVKEKPPAP
jgi:nicotinamidase-related amidase